MFTEQINTGYMDVDTRKETTLHNIFFLLQISARGNWRTTMLYQKDLRLTII